MFSCFKDKEFLKRFMQITLPVMAASFVSFLVNFIDNIMVGSVSNEAVSGVYAANQVTFIFELALYGVLEGAGIFMQQFNGNHDTKRLKECFNFKIITTIIFGIIVIPCVYLFGHYLVTYYSISDSNYELIYKEGMDYLYLVAISFIPMMFLMVISTSLREVGKTKYAMIGSLISIGVNALFNFIFIMIFHLGVKGAAYATILARCCEFLYLYIVCKVLKFEFSHEWFKYLKIEKDLTKNIFKRGWLLFLNEIGFSVGMMLQTLAYSQRDGVLASISIVSTIGNIFGILITGLSTGIGVMVGSSLGNNEFDKAIDENKKLNYLGFYASIVFGILLIALSPVLPHMFKEVDASQKALATKLIIIYATFLFARTLAVTSYFTLRVGGKALQTFFLDTGLMILLYVPVSWVLAVGTNLDMIYIYLIVTAIDLPKAIFGIWLMKKKKWVVNLTKIKEEGETNNV